MREVLHRLAAASGIQLLKSAVSPRRNGEHDRAQIVWPSGRGNEIGVIVGTPNRLSALALRNRRRIAGAANLDISDVFETGARAVVLRGIDRGPVCLTMEPELATDRVAIIADSESDPQQILRQLRLLFGPSVSIVS